MTDVKCPVCGKTNASKNGGTLRRIHLTIKKPGIDEQIIAVSANASCIRDISRVLKASKQKVTYTYKKQ